MPGKSRRRRPEEFGLVRSTDDGSPGSSSSDEEAPPRVSLARYESMGLRAVLGGWVNSPGGGSSPSSSCGPYDVVRPHHREAVQATSELAHVLLTCLRVAEKPAAGVMVEDAVLAARAMAWADTAAHLAAAARLQRAARQALPQAKYKAFDSAFRSAAIARKKRTRKMDNDARTRREMDEDEDAEEASSIASPVTIVALPDDVLALVMARLGPHDLARASCVSRGWRDRSYGGKDDALGGSPVDEAWRRACLAAFGADRTRAARRGGETDVETVAGPASWRTTYLRARRRWPGSAVEPTGRVFCSRCRTLLWESEAETRQCGNQGKGARCHRTVSFPPHRAARYLQTGDGSDTDDSDEDTSSDSDSNTVTDGGGGGGVDTGVRGAGEHRRRRHRLWRIPTM